MKRVLSVVLMGLVFALSVLVGTVISAIFLNGVDSFYRSSHHILPGIYLSQW
jgi:hypothetical protein